MRLRSAGWIMVLQVTAAEWKAGQTLLYLCPTHPVWPRLCRSMKSEVEQLSSLNAWFGFHQRKRVKTKRRKWLQPSGVQFICYSDSLCSQQWKKLHFIHVYWWLDVLLLMRPTTDWGNGLKLESIVTENLKLKLFTFKFYVISSTSLPVQSARNFIHHEFVFCCRTGKGFIPVMEHKVQPIMSVHTKQTQTHKKTTSWTKQARWGQKINIWTLQFHLIVPWKTAQLLSGWTGLPMWTFLLKARH